MPFMTEPTSWLWLALIAIAACAITVDLLVYRRRRGEITPRRALAESAAWFALALIFGFWISFVRGRHASIEFFTGYLVEESLSIDNVFLFLVIFHSFGISPRAQHRVLYYGVAGALVLRAGFVFAGVALLNRFGFVVYIFGAILLFTALRMLIARRSEGAGPAWIVRLAARFLPVSERTEGQRFFVRENGKLLVTSLFLALLAIEVMDVIFAADSIPAVLSITRDTFIAYSSNLFAVLGLRAIYFVLAGILRKVRFLREGLAAVLIFTGLKMVLSNSVALSDQLSLAVIAGIFGLTALASLCWPVKEAT